MTFFATGGMTGEDLLPSLTLFLGVGARLPARSRRFEFESHNVHLFERGAAVAFNTLSDCFIELFCKVLMLTMMILVPTFCR